MLSGLSNISVENEVKAKRSLLAASTALILFSNVTILSDRLVFLQLEILVSQKVVVGVAKFAVWLSLFAFILVIVENSPKRLARFKRWWDARWWAPIQEGLNEMYYQPHFDDEYEEPGPEEWEHELFTKRRLRTERTKRLISLYKPIARSKRFVTEFVWPLAVAYIALAQPEMLLILV